MKNYALFFLLSLLGLFCGQMGDKELELVYHGKIINRGQAKAMLRAAVGINMVLCPDNANAALYAQDFVIPNELDKPHYNKDSIDGCFVALLLTPCDLRPNTSFTVLSYMYTSVIRSCKPVPVGLSANQE